MLTLVTTAAELHLHVNASAERSLLYEARFVPETTYRLATREYLRDLDCSLRILPRRDLREPHAGVEVGWLCIIVDPVDESSVGRGECLVEASVDPVLFDDLFTSASAGHLPSRVSFGLAPIECSPQEGALCQVSTTTEFPLAEISFAVPLTSRHG